MNAKTEPPAITENTIWHVGISGGKDSQTALLWLLHDAKVPVDKLTAVFCDTGNEHEWTYKHIAWLSANVHPIKTIRADLDFYGLVRKKNFFPSVKARYCTELLKIVPSQEYIQSLQEQGKAVISVSGVRADESFDRAQLQEWDYNGHLMCYQWRPLITWTLPDVLDYNRKLGVPLNPLYAIGAKRVGCWPCIFSCKSELRVITQRFPERIAHLRQLEIELTNDPSRPVSFFRPDKTPLRFRSMSWTRKDGKVVQIPNMDDVARWSLTGDRARGVFQEPVDSDDHPMSCRSGMCE